MPPPRPSSRRTLRSRIARSLAALAACAPLVTASAAHAQNAKVAAQALFEEGRRLMAEGKPAEACPKFADSEKLDHSPATLLNLANCYEKTDRAATSWATYREAASAAAAAGRQDLVATAQRHAEALAPALPRVTVTVSAPVEGMAVRFDGIPMGRGQWGVALPVDPGEHTIDASAPQFKPWSSKLTVAHDAKGIPVAVPALEALPPEPVAATPPLAASPATAPTTAASPTPAAPPSADASSSHTQRTVAIIVGSAGVVALGIGGAFAISAKAKYNNSLAQCPRDANLCSPAGVSQRDDARAAGNVATLAIGVGLAAVVGGVVLWATAPSGAPAAQVARVEIAPTLGGAMVSGLW